VILFAALGHDWKRRIPCCNLQTITKNDQIKKEMG
jgi:hypothetical protein